MKREMDLIRELLLKLEALHVQLTGIKAIDGHEPAVQIDGYTTEQIDYHLLLLEQAGFIHGGGLENFGMRLGPGIGFQSLTWAGHDFLEAIRSPEVWAKTKAGALAAGGFTMELLADLAKGFIKKQIEDRIGVKL